tara:strand:- start:254 stop:1228 length:975 start_codon:yes stop_codon:yes gene_type:complete
MDTTYYNIDFFKTRVFEKEYSLHNAIKELIDNLNEAIAIPAEVQENSSLFRNNDRSLRRTHSSGSRRGLSKASSKSSFGNLAEDWEAIRGFKATKMEEKEGIDKHISVMRGLLNKMSPKNYDSQKNAILEELENILKNDLGQEEETQLFDNMFSIMSTNSFLSRIYADLYLELVGIHESFEEMVDDFVEVYKKSLHEIHYIDPNVDYDGFCEYNKKNDKRKCHVEFIVNLMKLDMISKESVLHILIDTISLIQKYMFEENRQNEIEALADNVVLFVNESYEKLEHLEKWSSDVIEQIKLLTKINIKECTSFSSRAKFKFMDCKC